MAKIEWSQQFSFGVPALDEQHKRFIELAYSIGEAVRNGEGARDIASRFSKLREYTVYHFSDEESFMRSVGYPGFKAHSKEHEELKKMVRHLQSRLFKEKKVCEKDIREFLKKLLVDHVIYADLGVKRFLEGKQEKQPHNHNQASVA